MGQHRALGPARGARGVEDRRQIVGARGHRRRQRVGSAIAAVAQAAAAVGVQRVQRRAASAMPVISRPASPAVADHQARRCVAEEIVQLRGGIGGVQRQKHQPAAHAGGIDRQRLRRLGDLHAPPGRPGQPQIGNRHWPAAPTARRSRRRSASSRPPAAERAASLSAWRPNSGSNSVLVMDDASGAGIRGGFEKRRRSRAMWRQCREVAKPSMLLSIRAGS